jgi:hypothetical protein
MCCQIGTAEVARAAAHVLATALCALRTARLPDPVRLGQIGLATVRLYEDAGLRLRAVEALPSLPPPVSRSLPHRARQVADAAFAAADAARAAGSAAGAVTADPAQAAAATAPDRLGWALMAQLRQRFCVGVVVRARER